MVKLLHNFIYYIKLFYTASLDSINYVLNLGDTFKLREHPNIFNTTKVWKHSKENRLIIEN